MEGVEAALDFDARILLDDVCVLASGYCNLIAEMMIMTTEKMCASRLSLVTAY